MPRNQHPLVTAYVTCFNQAKYVVNTLNSIRAQTYPNMELIVCDDCSSDGSPKIIRTWIEKNWPEALFIEHPKNMGICKTFNEIIRAARGKYLACVAGDDLWLPGKTAMQVAILESCPPQVGVVFGDANLMEESGEWRSDSYLGGVVPAELRKELGPLLLFMSSETLRRTAGHPPSASVDLPANSGHFTRQKQELFFKLLIRANVIPAMTTLVKKACYDKVGPYDESLSFEDWDMWIRISRHFSFVFLDEPTARYRLHAGSMSRTHQAAIRESTEAMFRKYVKNNWLQGTGKEEDGKQCLKKHALQLYRDGSSKRHGQLLWLAWLSPRREHVFMLLSSLLGLSYEHYLAVQKWIILHK